MFSYREPGSESSTCFAGAHSPWPPPFAPPAPPRPPVRAENLDSAILMMETPENRSRCDETVLSRSSERSIHVQRSMPLDDIAIDAISIVNDYIVASLASRRLRSVDGQSDGRSGVPTPVPTETGPMPTDKGLRSDDRDGLQDRWEPSIQLDQEQAIPFVR